MPYNYLIDEKIRENYGIEYTNSVIIFDEAHNIAPCSEEVSSFEVKAGYLDKCLIELNSLQQHHEQNTDKEWKATKGQLGQIELLTERFVKYITKFSLDSNDNPKSIPNVSNNRYLPSLSIVLPGSEIFNLFFEATRGETLDACG